MIEKEIEKQVVQYAVSLGVLSYKFVSPNHRGVPDRIFFYNGHTLCIEFKSSTASFHFSPLQQKCRDQLASRSIPVFLCNDVDKGKSIIDKWTAMHPPI